MQQIDPRFITAEMIKEHGDKLFVKMSDLEPLIAKHFPEMLDNFREWAEQKKQEIDND